MNCPVDCQRVGTQSGFLPTGAGKFVWILAWTLLPVQPLFPVDVITSPMSAVVSYQYVDSLSDPPDELANFVDVLGVVVHASVAQTLWTSLP